MVPVLLYLSVSPCSAAFSLYLDLLLLPSQTAVPLCLRAFPSAVVTMALLCENSSKNYLLLGFAVQPWAAGLCPSLVHPFPVGGGTGLEAALSAGHGCAVVPRDLLQVSGHQDATALCQAGTQVQFLLFLNVGQYLGRDEPCKTHSHSSPPETGLTANRASASPIKTVGTGNKQLGVCRNLCTQRAEGGSRHLLPSCSASPACSS